MATPDLFSPTSLSTDHCTQCDLCTAACPVLAVSPTFAGPKANGPLRLRQSARTPTAVPTLAATAECNGCGMCSLACPHDVAVTALNIQAKAQSHAAALPAGSPSPPHPLQIGAWQQRLAPLLNSSRHWAFVRWMLARWQNIHPKAPLPSLRQQPLEQWFEQNRYDPVPAQRKVLYFASCHSHNIEMSKNRPQ